MAVLMLPKAQGYDKAMKILLLILTIFVFACAPSQEEKENIAIIACNIMGETKNIDAAFRIREINNAREQIGAPPFLGSDKEILESFQYELCKDLVLDDNYQEKLSAQISLEEERLRKQRELAEKAEAEARAELERDRLAKIELYKKNYGEALSEYGEALSDYTAAKA